MAELLRKNKNPSPPEPNRGAKIFGVIVLIAAIILFALSIALMKLILAFFGLCLLVVGVVFISSGSANYSPTSYKKAFGDMGERRTGLIFERYLPEDYTVIQNITITYEGRASEIDNIIVGKTGIFVVEVKNVKGTVIGNFSSNDWVQDKVDNYDIEHIKTLYNPVKQTSTHIYRLAGVLKENGIFTFIKGAVYFANPETKLNINGENEKAIPIFSARNTNELLDYIMNGNANLSKKQIEKILEILE